MTPSPRFSAAIQQFDEANRQDPNSVDVGGGAQAPATLDYAQRMTAWLNRLAPDASEALQLAVRCQHLKRWAFPRDRYPMTRPGYHQWRTAAARFHAEEAGKILKAVGYDDAEIARVQAIVRKEALKTDPETQTLEDATCLAFLERGFAEFAAQHDDDKVIGIIRRTWKKMSPRGQGAALTLNLTPDAGRLIGLALSTEPIEPAGQSPTDSTSI
jgi:hypothetical protein